MKAIASLLLAAALLGGCQSSTASSSRRLSTEIFEDLPAPRTAVYRKTGGESFSFLCRSFRCGRFVYDYPGSHEEAVSFFAETLTQPPYSWTLADSKADQVGSARMVFTKGEDRCTVEVDRVQKVGPNRANVVIRVRLNYLR